MSLLSLNDTVTLFEDLGLAFKPRPVGSEARQMFAAVLPMQPGSYQAPAAENHAISLSHNSIENMDLENGWVGTGHKNSAEFMFVPTRSRLTWDIPSPQPTISSQHQSTDPHFFLIFPQDLLKSKFEDYTHEEIDPGDAMKGLASKPSRRFRWFEQEIRSELVSAQAGRDCVLDTLTDALLVEMVRMYCEAGKSTPELQFSKTEIAFIERSIAEAIDTAISIRELSDGLGLTPSTFTRRFSATFGTTPTQYVLNIRLGQAKQLLETTDLSIAEIAYASGFSSQAHLTSRFSSHCGITPGRYRAEVLARRKDYSTPP